MATLETMLVPATSIFDMGNIRITGFKVRKCCGTSPPVSLYIVTPTEEGTYPVVKFHHGFLCWNTWYSLLLKHISSHGYIIVAPQCDFFCTEINNACAVTNWLSKGLEPLLPPNVGADLTRLALAGHSRGGKTAFCLALGKGHPTLRYSALIGIDPVAKTCMYMPSPPEIFSYIPRSLDIDIPISIIGTGLGNETCCCIIPPMAPNGCNHAEFFNESKPNCYYFLAKDYGHMDMCDDWVAWISSWIMKSKIACKMDWKTDLKNMRMAIGGIVVAFLEAAFGGITRDIKAIGDDPGIAPIKLDPIIFVESGDFADVCQEC